MNILDILQELKAQTGKGSAGRKMEILLKHKDNLLLKDFFYWCLEPSINYWQSKIDLKFKKFNGYRTDGIQDTMETILEDLSTRKITGHKAKAVLTGLYHSLSPENQELLHRIITGKPDVGFNVGTVNKVWPNLIYDPAYMRCKGYSPKLVEDWDFEGGNVWSDIKADGMFNNIILTTKLKFETRSGEDLAKVVDTLDPKEYFLPFDKICRSLSDVKDPVLHSELVCWKDGKAMERTKSNGLINKIKLGGSFPKGVDLIISVWDYIPLHNFITHEPYLVKYKVRRAKLKTALKDVGESVIQFIGSKKVTSQLQAQQHFVSCLQKGLEGTILKNGEGIWKYHTSPNQLKLKNKFRFEMRVTGFTKGEGKFAPTFGSMEIESEDGLLKSAISGMKDKVRNHIHENRDLFKGSVVEVEANGLFKNDDGSLGVMHPRYKEHRTDRVEADTQERIIQQEIDSIMGKKIEGNGK